MRWTTAGAAALALLVAGCGYDRDERIGGGAAAGAATGAAVGALGGPPGMLAGAAIGGVAGGVTGATTSPQEVNLGRPLWDNPEVRTPLDSNNRRSSAAYRGSARGGSYAMAQSDPAVRRAQRELAQRGFDPGPVDGIWGPQTARATEDFQRANSLGTTGRLDSATMQALNSSGTGTASQARDRAYMGGGAVNTGSGAAGTGSTMGGGAAGGTSAGSTGPAAPTTPSTGPGGTSNVGSGNQPATGGTSNR